MIVSYDKGVIYVKEHQHIVTGLREKWVENFETHRIRCEEART